MAEQGGSEFVHVGTRDAGERLTSCGSILASRGQLEADCIANLNEIVGRAISRVEERLQLFCCSLFFNFTMFIFHGYFGALIGALSVPLCPTDPSLRLELR